MRRYGYNTLTLGNMVRIPGMSGAVRVPGLSDQVRVPGLMGAVRVPGLAGYRGLARFADVPTIVKLPEEPATKEDAPSSTNWNPIINALKAFSTTGTQTQTAVAPTGAPQWVWVAAPLVAGLAFLAIVARK